jgi:hypothetical protein
MNKYETSVRVARTTLLQRSSTTFLTVAALLFLIAGQAVCQVLYGSLVGRVTDSTGAVEPGYWYSPASQDERGGKLHCWQSDGRPI